MSFALLTPYGNVPRHCPLHDMESFFWVLVWTITQRIRLERDTEDVLDQMHCDVLRNLMPGRLVDAYTNKENLIAALYGFLHSARSRMSRQYGPLFPFIQALARDVTKWIEAATEVRKEVLPKELIEHAFASYLATFNAHLELLPDNWAFSHTLS